MLTQRPVAEPGAEGWDPVEPPVPAAAVIVAPHPDDEVLGLGMLMRWLQDAGCRLSLVACTDGEASHARSELITPDDLRVVRARERAEALDVLGLEVQVTRLRLPDGALGEHVEAVVESLLGAIGPQTTLVVPWEHDDHPDHRAAAAAAMAAASRTGAPIWQVPIWGKVRPGPGFTGRVSRLHLGPEAAAWKARAVDALASQLRPLGPGPFDGPVVHPDELAQMLDGSETVIW